MSEPAVEAMAEVRAHLADVIDRARRESTPTIISRRGKEEAIIIDLDAYRELQKASDELTILKLRAYVAENPSEGPNDLSAVIAETLERDE